jgi:hypothetical protein
MELLIIVFLCPPYQKKFSLGSSAKRMQVFYRRKSIWNVAENRIKQLLLLARFRYGREQSLYL